MNGQTHIADVRSVTGVRSQHAVEEVVVGTPLQEETVKGHMTCTDLSNSSMRRRYLLKDEEGGECSGNVQFDKVQAGLPVGQRCSSV